MDNQVNTRTRPSTIAGFRKIFRKSWDFDAERRGLAFNPRQGDIIISPYSKCGTTLMMQIAHSLRTRGSMDFEEIMAVVPWIEVAYDVGWDLDAEQVAYPRLFKSHMDWYNIPKGARYIVSFRHYYGSLESAYRFFEGWFFEPGSISLKEYTRWRWPREYMGERGY